MQAKHSDTYHKNKQTFSKSKMLNQTISNSHFKIVQVPSVLFTALEFQGHTPHRELCSPHCLDSPNFKKLKSLFFQTAPQKLRFFVFKFCFHNNTYVYPHQFLKGCYHEEKKKDKMSSLPNGVKRNNSIPVCILVSHVIQSNSLLQHRMTRSLKPYR